MANPEHVRIVRQGTDAIDRWKEEHPLEVMDLSGADLTRANLIAANLIAANLSVANFKDSILEYTIFANCNLSKCKNLSSVKHAGSSSIGIDTLIRTYKEADGFTQELEQFFINAGVPKELLDALPQIIREIKYHSCFISYGEPDKEFAKQLYDELKRVGVPCWLYEMDSTVGERTWKEITIKRREADKMIIICSMRSLIRDGVKKEIEEQIDEDADKIIPISLDEDWKSKGFKVERGDRDLKPFLLDKNYLDLTDRKITEDKLNRLLKALEIKHSSP